MFNLSNKEQDEANKFVNEHYESCGSSEFVLKGSETGIGVHYKIKCKVCDERKDITDYEIW